MKPPTSPRVAPAFAAFALLACAAFAAACAPAARAPSPPAPDGIGAEDPGAGGGQACTEEAMICPDGSSVGRTGPNCSFPPCPEGASSPGAPPIAACTKDAKVCPDGSVVGRTGPSCSFAPCPGEVGESAPPGEPDHGSCKNLCGNGTCEEIVCMAVGCPCAESKASCPQDCK